MKSFDRIVWNWRDAAMRPRASNILSRAKRIIARRTWRHVQSFKGVFIPLSVQIETVPVFPHGLDGIFISGDAQIGKDCVIFHQVTIGKNTLPDSPTFGSPILGDSVYIGAGAKIIGRITIGNNVRIGANAVVTIDVPDNTTVVGLNEIKPQNRARDNRFVARGEDGWYAFDSSGKTRLPEVRQEMLDQASRR
ncbi:serine acetyltransferase [Alteripontixanthobacter maritimus]|uniref:serine acetyltransferase n=1 Tax=Alteripontixanthobacter maritimus TaxID=2161824 RepID=UPI001E5EC2E5|nr:serine acetyltransferase [Alteripontixanthobacter maritimus]